MTKPGDLTTEEQCQMVAEASGWRDRALKAEAALSSTPSNTQGALEAAAKVADAAAQKAREAIAECKPWSRAQAEWSRARDMALNIADDIRALALKSGEAGHGVR